MSSSTCRDEPALRLEGRVEPAWRVGWHPWIRGAVTWTLVARRAGEESVDVRGGGRARANFCRLIHIAARERSSVAACAGPAAKILRSRPDDTDGANLRYEAGAVGYWF